DLVFIGLHGKFGEDGCIQGLLDMLNIPYVGSGVMASAVAMDKYQAKQLFATKNIPIAKGEKFHIINEKEIEMIINQIHEQFELPFVIKPNREGSTLGLTIVTDYSQTELAIKNAIKSDKYILVEQFISGKELTVPVIGK